MFIKEFFVGDKPSNVVIASRIGATFILTMCALAFWAVVFI